MIQGKERKTKHKQGGVTRTTIVQSRDGEVSSNLSNSLKQYNTMIQTSVENIDKHTSRIKAVEEKVDKILKILENFNESVSLKNY